MFQSEDLNSSAINNIHAPEYQYTHNMMYTLSVSEELNRVVFVTCIWNVLMFSMHTIDLGTAATWDCQ